MRLSQLEKAHFLLLIHYSAPYYHSVYLLLFKLVVEAVFANHLLVLGDPSILIFSPRPKKMLSFFFFVLVSNQGKSLEQSKNKLLRC